MHWVFVTALQQMDATIVFFLPVNVYERHVCVYCMRYLSALIAHSLASSPCLPVPVLYVHNDVLLVREVSCQDIVSLGSEEWMDGGEKLDEGWKKASPSPLGDEDVESSPWLVYENEENGGSRRRKGFYELG